MEVGALVDVLDRVMRSTWRRRPMVLRAQAPAVDADVPGRVRWRPYDPSTIARLVDVRSVRPGRGL